MGRGLGLQRGRKAIDTEIEKQTFGKKKKKKCLLGHEGSVGHRVDSGLLRISPDTYPICFVGPLFRFFKQLGGRSKFLPKSFRS